MRRCGWAGPDKIYIRYHDQEWGVPEYDDQRLWQMLVLESFQAGLSWITILRRREGFFKAFQGLDPNIIANWGDVEVADLVKIQQSYAIVVRLKRRLAMPERGNGCRRGPGFLTCFGGRWMDALCKTTGTISAMLQPKRKSL